MRMYKDAAPLGLIEASSASPRPRGPGYELTASPSGLLVERLFDATLRLSCAPLRLFDATRRPSGTKPALNLAEGFENQTFQPYLL